MCLAGAVSSAFDRLSLPVVLGLALAAGLARGVELPSRTALVGNVVDRPKLLNAFSLISVALHGSEMVGPIFVTALLAARGAAPALLVCAILYTLSVIAMRSLPLAGEQQRRGGRTRRRRTVVGDIVAGLAYIRGDRRLRLWTVFAVAHCLLTMSYMGALPNLTERMMDEGSTAFGTVMTSIGAGAVLGTLLLALRSHAVNELRALLVTALGSGITLAGLALSKNLVTAVVMAIMVGASQTAFMVVVTKMMQAQAADAVRGRVASVASFLIAGSMGLFGFVVGALADIISPGVVLTAAGTLFTLLTAVGMIRVPEMHWPLGVETAMSSGRG